MPRGIPHEPGAHAPMEEIRKGQIALAISKKIAEELLSENRKPFGEKEMEKAAVGIAEMINIPFAEALRFIHELFCH